MAIVPFLWKKPIAKEEFVDKCLLPTCTIVNKKNQTTGTGFVIKSQKIDENTFSNIMLSCEHVVSNKFHVAIHEYSDVYFYSKHQIVPAICLAKSKEHDISIIMFVTNKELKTSTLSFDKNLKLRQKVFTFGCGLGDTPRFSEGQITELSPSKYNLQNIRTSVCMVPGDSGGALFNENNEVIGVANSIKVMGEGVPVTNISVFKSIQLFEKLYKNEKYEFVFSNSKMPNFLYEYLWLYDSEIGY